MKKTILIAIAVILVLVIIIATVVVWSKSGTGVQAFELLYACTQAENLSMELTVNAQLPDTRLNFTALVERSMFDGHRITTVTKDGRTLCYTQGVILPENGTAYRLSDAYPDHSQLLEQAMELYENVQVEAEDGIFSITATGTKPEQILQLLLPGTEVDADELTVELVTQDNQLTQIRFRGEFNDDCQLRAAVKILGREISVAIPEAVQQAIRSGQLDAAQDLSDDLLRLINAWSSLQNAQTMGAEVTLRADSGILQVSNRLKLYRKGNISAIEKYGMLFYFTDSAICDKNGNTLSTGDASDVETGQLMDLAWQLCMDSQLLCSQSDGSYTYTLALDKAAMLTVSQTIAPEIEESAISFQSGSITVRIQNDRIRSIQFDISGSLKALLVQVPIDLSAEIAIAENVSFQIPQAVQNALG